jgi:Mrp family chromosome partitioning ATPase
MWDFTQKLRISSMSRNYELMQQAELYLASTPAPTAETTSRAVREGVRNTEALSLDDDCLNLIQRVFLMESDNVPHVAVFAGLNQSAGARRICAAAGKHLAEVVRRPVCVVEADFRSRLTENGESIEGSRGLCDALMQEGLITDFCTPTKDDHLWLLTPGIISAGSPGLLTAENLKLRIGELREAFDFVVIEAPPLDRYAEAIICGQLADGLILVLESGSTRREESEQIVSTLRSSGIRILAAILNNFAEPIPGRLRKFI